MLFPINNQALRPLHQAQDKGKVKAEVKAEEFQL
jgi:hypothetical protein